MELGMADIPELATTMSTQRLDPRSGVVSPQAVSMRTEPDLAEMDFSEKHEAELESTSGEMEMRAIDRCFGGWGLFVMYDMWKSE